MNKTIAVSASHLYQSVLNNYFEVMSKYLELIKGAIDKGYLDLAETHLKFAKESLERFKHITKPPDKPPPITPAKIPDEDKRQKKLKKKYKKNPSLTAIAIANNHLKENQIPKDFSVLSPPRRKQFRKTKESLPAKSNRKPLREIRMLNYFRA